MANGKVILVAWVLALLGGTPCLAAGTAYDVRERGAKGDGSTLDTAAIQAAIDECSKAGGGSVHVPPGRYLTGTITLKDGVTLYLEKGAVLLGSKNTDDYAEKTPQFPLYTTRYSNSALIYAEGAHDVAITGEGEVDGQGAAFEGKRPYLIRFVSCDGVRLEEVTLRNGAMWTVHVLGLAQK